MAPLLRMIFLGVLSPVAVMSFVTVPTRHGLETVVAPGQKKAARSMPQRLAMAMDKNTETPAERGAPSASSTSRASFLRDQGVLGAGLVGMLGLSRPVAAARLFDLGQDDVVALEQVPHRMIIGKTQAVKWSSVAPSIAAMRAEARERFSATGAVGGREVAAFFNATPDGADVAVGLEVADPEGSPALGEGFTAGVISPPGQYLRDDRATLPGVVQWMTFVARAQKEGYTLQQPLSMFEVYTGTGGSEGVSMYIAVTKGSSE